MKILIICFDNIGDVVFCSILPREIKKNFKDARVDFLCKEYTKPIVDFIPDIDNIFSINPYWSKEKSYHNSRMDFFRFFLKLKKINYDVVINTSKSWRLSFYSKLVGVNKIIGFNYWKNSIFLTDKVEMFSKNIPVMESISCLLEPIKMEVTNKSYFLSVRGERVIRNDYIILHPFSGNIERCASIELWLQVASKLRNEYQILWFGMHKELNYLRLHYFEECEKDSFSDVLSGDNFSESIKFMVHAKLFVGHDSGPMHIASSIGISTLGLFLPGEPNRTFPQGEGRSKVLFKDNASLLSSAEVLSVIQELLTQSQVNS